MTVKNLRERKRRRRRKRKSGERERYLLRVKVHGRAGKLGTTGMRKYRLQQVLVKKASLSADDGTAHDYFYHCAVDSKLRIQLKKQKDG